SLRFHTNLSVRSLRLLASKYQQTYQSTETSEFEKKRRFPNGTGSLVKSLGNYALLGGAAALLLATVELLDLNVTLSPNFRSFSERLLFASYFALNVIVCFIVGFGVGMFVQISVFAKGIIERAVTRKEPGVVHGLVGGLIVAGLAAFILNQQPQIRGHAYEIIREAEKFESLTNILLNHERSVSYLLLMG